MPPYSINYRRHSPPWLPPVTASRRPQSARTRRIENSMVSLSWQRDNTSQASSSLWNVSVRLSSSTLLWYMWIPHILPPITRTLHTVGCPGSAHDLPTRPSLYITEQYPANMSCLFSMSYGAIYLHILHITYMYRTHISNNLRFLQIRYLIAS